MDQQDKTKKNKTSRKKRCKFDIGGFFAGLLVIFFAGYTIKLLVPAQNLIYLNITISILIAGLIAAAYFSYKDPVFRSKTVEVIKKILFSISVLGETAIKYASEEESSPKKKKKNKNNRKGRNNKQQTQQKINKENKRK